MIFLPRPHLLWFLPLHLTLLALIESRLFADINQKRKLLLFSGQQRILFLNQPQILIFFFCYSQEF